MNDVWVIRPLSQLPPVSADVLIDGYTQPGAVKNSVPLENGTNAQLKIVLDGQAQVLFGLTVTGGNSVVRGLVIQNWGNAALKVESLGGNHIEGNFIGTDATGTLRAAVDTGIFVFSSNNVVGGPVAADRNIISGASSGKPGVAIQMSSDNLVQGNLIGTDATGTQAISNGNGISIFNSVSNTSISDNVISGSVGTGIQTTGTITTVQRNRIGTTADGLSALPNQLVGVNLISGSSGSLVGGDQPEDGNVIAFNGKPSGGYGVLVSSDGDMILTNSIYSTTGGLGIDLEGDKQTAPNDTGDVDGGANHGQNYPPVTTVTAASGHVEGTFKSTASRQYRVEVFSSDACDPSGYGEGQRFLGRTGTVTTDVDGAADWAFNSGAALTPGTYITATATDLTTNETSEFSNCVLVAGPTTPTPIPTPTPTPMPTPVGQTPSPTPTATPVGQTPSPTPVGQTPSSTPTLTATATPVPDPVQGDLNCDGMVDEKDFVLSLAYAAELHDGGTPANCPDLGDAGPTDGFTWGDVNCDFAVNALDSLFVLAYTVDIALTPATPPCAPLGA